MASLYRPSAKMPRKFVGEISSWGRILWEREVWYMVQGLISYHVIRRSSSRAILWFIRSG